MNKAVVGCALIAAICMLIWRGETAWAIAFLVVLVLYL